MEKDIVCRTCLRATEKYVSIFSAPELWGKKIVLAKLIMACAPVIVKVGDGLPTKICENCLELLQLSFLFRLRVITANENYKEIIRSQVLSDPGQQVITGKQPSNFNQIYSSEYIFESINDQLSSQIVEAVKQEPLDIKEELLDKSNENSPSTASNVLSNPTLLDNNKLNSVAPNQQEIQNNQTEQINNSKKTVLCEEKNQPKNNIKNNVSYKNSQTTNNEQVKKVQDDNSFDEIVFSFPIVEKARLVADSPKNIISNEELIDSELYIKLLNNKKRTKRTYSKIDNSNITSTLSKTPKFSDSESDHKQLNNSKNTKTDNAKLNTYNNFSDSESDHKQLNNSKNTKTDNAKLNTYNNECIIIDD